MKKVKLILIITLSALALQGCNVQNTIGDIGKEDGATLWFEDTGIVVKDSYDKVYHILKDKNGWLYYNCQGDSAILEKVLDENGNITKDTSIFE